MPLRIHYGALTPYLTPTPPPSTPPRTSHTHAICDIMAADRGRPPILHGLDLYVLGRRMCTFGELEPGHPRSFGALCYLCCAPRRLTRAARVESCVRCPLFQLPHCATGRPSPHAPATSCAHHARCCTCGCAILRYGQWPRPSYVHHSTCTSATALSAACGRL